MTFRHGRLGGNCAVRPLLAAALFLLCLAMAVPAQAQPGPRLTVVATTNIVGDTVRQVVGDAAEVVTLMAPGVDPHLYRATQNDLRRLSQADVIFYNGLNLEGRMADVLAQMSRRKPTFAVTEYMTPEELLPSAGFGGLYDPHVWFDVSLWIKAVERIRDAMIEVDPARSDYYAANAARFIEELRALDEEVAAAFAAVPAERRVLVTAHDAFEYLGARYGIEVVALQGISTEAEYGLADVRRLVDLLVERNIGVVFVETSVSPRGIQAVVEGARARGHQVELGGQLYSDSLGAAGTPEGTYVGMIRYNVQLITSALR
ncbi:MAG: zinc ABC transporter substrate-binding protein [Limnochordales bacterium]|jgi:ABC-type metal ion transport system, periplasmic component/surface adhesin